MQSLEKNPLGKYTHTYICRIHTYICMIRTMVHMHKIHFAFLNLKTQLLSLYLFLMQNHIDTQTN